LFNIYRSYDGFTSVCAFPLKLSGAASGETTDRIRKKVRKVQKRTDVICRRSEYGEVPTADAAGRRKCSMFF